MDVKYFQERLSLTQERCHTSCGAEVVFYHRGLKDIDEKESSATPILVLIHGYPQSSFCWRHIIPLLPKDIPLFVPDIPGYGLSLPSTQDHDKRTIGFALLEALSTFLSRKATSQRMKIIIAGHDRGARICHRLAVDRALVLDKLEFDIVKNVLLDIVPTLTQFESFADSKVGVGSFHWPFLANVPLATAMITSHGGSTFAQTLIHRWAGRSSTRLVSLYSENSLSIYGDYFSSESVIKATCEDYAAGANEDVKLQKLDQQAIKKIECPTLVLFSEEYLGSRFDMRGVWREWMQEGIDLTVTGIKETGHFLAEEAAEETVHEMMMFMEVVRE